MRLQLRRRSIWLALNFVGVTVYLWLAASLWVRPGEEGEPGGPGDGFYWLFCLLPVLLVYLVINVIALVTIVQRLMRGGRHWSALSLWLVSVSLWAGAIAYDHHRSVRYIDAQYTSARGNSCEA